MRPQYRFTLDLTKVISEPIGWNQMIPELNRDTKYWSLVESIEIPLMFYGNSADGDGGYEFIKQARSSGPDAQIEILVEISWDFGSNWETFFDGLLDMTESIDMETERKFQCTLTRSSKWSRFINQQDVPVIVSDTATAHNLTLPSQEIRQLFVGIHSGDVSYNLAAEWGIIDWAQVTRSEINLKSNLPRVDSPTVPAELFEMEFAGYYSFHGDVYIASAAFFPSNQITGVNVRIQINNDAPINWTMEQLGTNGIDGRTHFYYHAQHTLQKGDQVRIYFFGSAAFIWTDFFLQGLTVIADTIFPTSTVSSFFIHDVARAIVNNLSNSTYFYSDYFGGRGTQTTDYDIDGCGVYYRLLKGRHIRGESLVNKPFSLSWSELWEGLDPIFMLGAGYENQAFTINGGVGPIFGSNYEVVKLEPREHFFDDSDVSVSLDQYDMDFKLGISYDPDFLITSIKIGYQKWQAQSISGVDDPQTQHTYGTRFKTVGSKGPKNPEVLSSFIAASLAIEQGRRLSQLISQDWPLDEDTFIIQANSSLSPDEVRLYSNDVVTGLQNADTRYNIRLTPASNFNRWIRWFSIAFQEYIGDVFSFRDGQGNIAMVFDNPGAVGCDAEAGTYAAEGEDIDIMPDSIILPLIYKFNCAFTWANWKAVRDNRRKAIQLNYRKNDGSDVSAILFIKSLKYDPSKSEAEFECWLKRTQTGLLLQGSLTGFGTWSFEDSGLIGQFFLTGPTDSGSVQLPGVTGSVNIIVGKDTNGGLAQGNGEIRFYKNGVLEPGTGIVGSGMGTQTFVNTGNVGVVDYIYSAVVATDILSVEIEEI